MRLEDCFDFSPLPNDWIPLKGRRIAMQHVIELCDRPMIAKRIARYFACPLTNELTPTWFGLRWRRRKRASDSKSLESVSQA
jgi:hypothetical protein